MSNSIWRSAQISESSAGAHLPTALATPPRAAPPDMFYAIPHLRLVAGSRAPRATEAQLNFDGQSWQRWSRHNDQWRPGFDGLWTMIKRIETALAVAA